MRWADTGQANAGIRAESKQPVDRTPKEQRENLESKNQFNECNKYGKECG
jgi:hypothetical protein